MLSGRSLQRHSARWRRGLEFNVMAIAIHRGQFAKMVVRLLGSIVIVIAGHSGDALATPQSNQPSTRTATDDQITAAMRTVSAGYSVDEIVIDDQRRERFLSAIDPQWQSVDEDWQRDTLLRLLSLRKAGKIDSKATQRGPAAAPELAHIAEIAARSVLDQHPVSTDTLLCDPRLRRQLQAAATRLAGNPDAYSIRKHLLRLRKTRQLRPELVQRVADWDRTIDSLSVDQLIQALGAGEISTGPGVYLFYDPTGYLYIGEAANLKARLLQHTSQSDRVTLNEYLHSGAEGSITVELHTFGDRSPAKELTIRRAYESELIRSRQPRFNIRP